MCGIYGLLQLSGAPISRAHLSAMGAVTVHRGPDDEGLHVDGACGIGMRRLSIIDLAGGHQPLSTADGRLWVVCNGEIYNFQALREELRERGHLFRTGSDCEVLLHLYREHGDAFVQKLNGMFAFALWDAPRRRLLIGRDRLGIKPLYLHATPERVAFASEAKALLTLPGLSARLSLPALDSYLALGYVPAPQSMFAGIEKLPPATLLSVENGRVERHTYWSLPAEVDPVPSERGWADAVRARLEEAVRMQMVSDVPIGAFLSGGIDSSSVVAFMARHTDRPVRTYAIGFEGGSAEQYYNELPYARQVAQRFGTEHHEIVVRPDVSALLPSLLWHLDEPIADSAFITTYLVSEFARRDVTVILSGVGGDELFGGYRRYLGNHYQERFGRLPAWVRRTLTQAGQRLPSDRHSPLLNAARLAKSFLGSAELPFEARYRSYVEVFSPAERQRLVRAAAGDPFDALDTAFAGARSPDALNRMLAVDAQTQLPDDLLLLTDKMSMAVSLECRVPLLDHELVELAARIPEGVKLRRGRLKHVMKAALADVLPAQILHRKKRGFGTPMGAWLRRDMAPLLRHLLSEETLRRRGLLDPAVVAQLIREHDARRVDATDRLLALLNLEIWWRVFLDRARPSDVADEMREAA
jgi:asparagine synthase (glutamine-hydrolysing)